MRVVCWTGLRHSVSNSWPRIGDRREPSASTSEIAMGLLSDMQRSSLARVRDARSRCSESELRAAARATAPPPGVRPSSTGFDLIAELKLRSPSMGDLSVQTSDPLVRLEGYARGGAAIISVLTEPERFGGDLGHLRIAADRVRTYDVPVMRKDFLVDPYQVLEARAHGAAGVLLILRMVDRSRLIEMLDCALELGLFVLLEAFDADDLALAIDVSSARADRGDSVLMGLNCRDLETLAIDFGRFSALRERMPSAWPAVAESGVIEPADAARVAHLGYRYALVGTSLMQRADPEAAVAELLAAGRGVAAERGR
jgi:indole-3-glycerol phosphate synthase